MGKSIQINRQTTVVKVNQSCRSRKIKRHNCRSKKKTIQCVTVLCGDIFQRCGEDEQYYFIASRAVNQGYIRVTNDTACAMIAVLQSETGEIERPIAQGQQVSFSVPNFLRLAIRCDEGTGVLCQGRYEIRLFRRNH